MSDFNVKDNNGNWVPMASMDDISGKLSDAQGSIEKDGKQYARQDGEWVEVEASSGKMDLVSNPVSGNILVTDENGQAQNSECGISEVTSMAISTIINDSSSDDEIPTAEAVKEYVDEHGGGSAEKITSQIVGDGSTIEFSITHNLNNREVFVVVYDVQYNDVLCDIQRTSNNTVKVIFNEAPEVGSTYTAVVQTPGGAKGPKGDSGGVEEAPENDKQYARKNGEWTEVTAGGLVNDVQLDGVSIVQNKVANISGMATKTWVAQQIQQAIYDTIGGEY